MAVTDSTSSGAVAGTASDETGQFVMPDDIRKQGYMRKLKTNKRKYFVLRLNHPTDYGKATLSYYDNEKKFRANPGVTGQTPRRTILLNDCFAISRKVDAKHKHVLALYTREDCLGTILEDERQLNDWLESIRAILYQSIDYQHRPLRDFEHVWQVNINRTGLGLARNITGLHRFCLSDNILYVIRVDPNADNPDVYEFPLSSIRRCGHTTSTFFLELGRSSLLGPGELWIQTEDQVVAQNMHEIILMAMTAGSSTLEEAETASYRKNSSTTSNNNTCSSSTTNSMSSVSHRPRSSSASAENNNLKSTTGGSSACVGSTRSTNSGRLHSSFKHSLSMGNSASAASGGANFIPTLFDHSSHGPFMHCGSAGGCHGHCHGRMSGGGVSAQSTTSQSPSTSRERLHSGSWSRTTSECSNEDSSQGGFSSNSSSAAATPVGLNNPLCCDCTAAHHLWSSSNMANVGCCSPSIYGHGTFPMDFSNGNSSSSLSIDCDSDHSVGEFHSCPSASMVPLEPPISEEESATNDDYFPMAPSNQHSAHKSNVPGSMSTCVNMMNHHYLPPLYCLQLQHMMQLSQFHGAGGRHHRNSQTAAGVTSHGSPVSSPKCPCASCCYAAASGGGSYLPPIAAGSTSDYLPMTPVGATGSSDQAVSETDISNGRKTDMDQKDGYLHMAPLSPCSKSSSAGSCTTTATSVSSSNIHGGSSSIEFHLEKVRSYYNEDETAVPGAKSSNSGQTAVPTATSTSIGHQSSTQDDSIFNGLTRAYSTGSKPQPLAPSLGAQCTTSGLVAASNGGAKCQSGDNSSTPNNAANSSSNNSNSFMRIRAFSTGSHGVNLNAIRLNSRRKKQQQVVGQQHPSVVECAVDTGISSASSSSLDGGVSVCKKNHKASSAPVLSPLIQQRTRSATLGSKPSSSFVSTVQHLFHHPSAIKDKHAAQHHHHSHHLLPGHNAAHGHHFTHHVNTSGDSTFGVGANGGACSGKKMPYCAHDTVSLHSQSSSSVSHSTAVAAGSHQESDLMEIDYSSKAKNRSRTSQTGKSDVILSGFQEEILREEKKKECQRMGATSRNSANLSQNNADSNGNSGGRKRSDSTSALSNIFTTSSRPASSHHHGRGTDRQQNHGHHHHHNTLDSWVASFKHSLNLQSNGGKSSSQKDSTTDHSGEAHKSHGQETDGGDYLLLNPSKTGHHSHQHQSKDQSGRLRKSTSGKGLKQVHLGDTTKTDAEGDEEYTLMAPLAARGTAKSDITSGPKSHFDGTTESSGVDGKKKSSMPTELEEEEEESSYVLMAPTSSSTSSKNKQSNSSGKKSKQSTMRSLISSLGGGSSSSSHHHHHGTTSSGNNSGKKSSTLSGRLRLNRSNSSISGSNDSQDNSNSGGRKRKSSSKSESSTTPTPVSGNDFGLVADGCHGSTNTTTATPIPPIDTTLA